MNPSNQRAVVIFLGALLLAAPAQSAIVINEIMYHPQSEDVREEFLELLNTGPAAVDVSGWKLTRGVQLTIPPGTVVAGGGFLVVCADPPTFVSKHAGVTNFVGGWTGILSNSGQIIELQDAVGNTVNQVIYADDGDWAIRRRGNLDYGHRGWDWGSDADGIGDRSMELIDPTLTNNSGQNWAPSLVAGGTPGRANSTAAVDVPPLILSPQHLPIVPNSTQPITFTARLLDESTTGLGLKLHWRLDGSPAFQVANMTDDGTGPDGQAGDLEYAVQIPAQTNLAIVEFYFEASDAGGHVRFWPAPSRDLADSPVQLNNALLQIDDDQYQGTQPIYRMIMTAADRAELYQINRNLPAAPEPQPAPFNDQTRSHARFNATFVSTDGVGTEVRYLAGVRNRGNGSRTALPQGYNIGFTQDVPWKGQVSLNLNSQNSPYQVVGAAIFQRAGLAMADSRAVQVRLNGENLTTSGAPSYGFYAANEVVNSEFADHHFPLDPSGNLYRGIRLDTLGGANLRYQGTDPGPYRTNYFKQSNSSVDDWSDLIHLTDVLNNSPDSNYVAAVEQAADVAQWMRYFAVNTIVDNNETSLANGDGDDYFLYSGVADPRFRIIPYDLDTILGIESQSVSNGLFRMTTIPALNRFMKRPEFAPLYYAEMLHQLDTTFSPNIFEPLLEQVLGGQVTQGLIDGMKQFETGRIAFLRSQIPLTISVTNDLAVQDGYPRSTASIVTLRGTANVVNTRRVLVNGIESTWSAWDGHWTNSAVSLNPGINRVLIQALNSNDVVFESAYTDIWYDNGAVTPVSGTVAGNVTWTSNGGPYVVNSTVNIPSGATLTIAPGTTVYFAAGAGIVVSGTGRLAAEGTATQRIRFTRAPAASGTWGNIQFLNTTSESRLVHVDLEFAGGAQCVRLLSAVALLDDVRFAGSTVQYVTIDDSSFIIRNSIFPTTSGVELIHGHGLPAGGYAIFEGNFFGGTTGLNDIIDFTGGKRPNAIPQFLNNVFTAGSDDVLDLDGTDAHVEGNIFLNTHQSASLVDSSSAISGGQDSGLPSHIVIARNFFYDCDHMALAKENNFYDLMNNTALKLRLSAVVFDEPGRRAEGVTPGRGAYLDGNIIWDAPANFEYAYVNDPQFGTLDVAVNRSILPAGDLIDHGMGNLRLDPRFFGSTDILYSNMTNRFKLGPGSPALGSGPNGADMGALVPTGVTLAGEPYGTTWKTLATLTVGGAGYVNPGLPDLTNYYRFKVNDGAWSAPVEISVPIQLSGLTNGAYTVYAIGQNDAGGWQSEAAATASRTWTVNTNSGGLRINEVLASNATALENGGAFPDVIELFNNSGLPVDLGNMSLTDNSASPRKYVFPSNTVLPSGGYLVVYADTAYTAPGLHTGFSIKKEGDDLYLFDVPGKGGALVDSVVFGPQLTDLSIGRLADGGWALTQPTLGFANSAERTGDPSRLRINEWLAHAQWLAPSDFIELFNPDTLPVDLGGLFLSDNPIAAPTLSPIPPLSFIPAGGFLAFSADGNPGQGATHLAFKLAAEQGMIGLANAAGTLIDTVFYGPQRTDVAEGRSPSGGDQFAFFLQPTPGSANPGAASNVSLETVSLVNLTNTWRYDARGIDLGTTWREPAFDDSAWVSGRAIFYGTNISSAPTQFTNTFVDFTNPRQLTFYYRTPFVVTNATAGASLNLKSIIDDGAVYYLNGIELSRENMPGGTVNYSTLAQSTVSSATFHGPVLVPSDALVSGTNWLAVEVHQINATSSDMAMGVELNMTFAVTNNLDMPVRLNEVLADNRSITNTAGRTVDYVELHNPGTNDLDLADLSLSNDTFAPRKFVFGANSIIPAGGYRVVLFDNNVAASSTNTGFSLSRGGDAVYFFDQPANGGALLDSVVFGPQVPDYSIGRTPDGAGSWALDLPSPGAANVASAMGDPSRVRINEWMASPVSGADWFELFNPSAQPVALGGYFLTDSLVKPDQQRIPALTFIGTARDAWLKFIADGDTAAGADHVGFSLAAAGESIGLFGTNAPALDAVTFGAQATGVSQGRLPDGAAQIYNFVDTPTPEGANFLPLPGVVVNEILSHTDPPLEDAVEFVNTNSVVVDLGGWWLSNDGNQPQKFQIPTGTIIQPSGYQLFVESQFNGAGAVLPFTFNSAHGDSVFLSQTDGGGILTGYRATISFGAAANGVSFGRYRTSVGTDFPQQSMRTLGVANAYPLVGPVVLDELMFQPPAGVGDDGSAFEYIELFNRSDAAVDLFDVNHATNTWRLRGGVDFDFPVGVSLAAGSRLLLVNFDPAASLDALAAFRARYQPPANVPIYGPYSGLLSDTADTLRIERPDTPQEDPKPDAGFVPYIEVEHVTYQSGPPWPLGASGTGQVLQRLVAGFYANDPVNWVISPASPGAASLSDADGDGLPDSWEIHYFGSINDPRALPGMDPDGDHLTNLQEWISGTDPLDPASFLKVSAVSRAGDSAVVEFFALAGRTYSIVYRDGAVTGSWTRLQDVPPGAVDGVIAVTDPQAGLHPIRLYRLVTPALP